MESAKQPRKEAMMQRYWLMGAASAAFLCGASLSVSAAPAGGATAMRSTLQQSSVVEKAADRRCWWRDGVRHCSRRGARVYGYYYGRPRPEAFPTGSTAWWRAMDLEGRGGHGRGR